jgi:hypothetical protein
MTSFHGYDEELLYCVEVGIGKTVFRAREGRKSGKTPANTGKSGLPLQIATFYLLFSPSQLDIISYNRQHYHLWQRHVLARG